VEYLDTLATAYARTGNFEDAIKTQERAIALLKEKDDTGLHTEYIKRLNAYKAHKTWWKDAVEISKTVAVASHGGTDDNKDRSQPENRKPRASRTKATGGSIAASKKIYSIQVGAYVDMQNAKKMIKQLKEKNYDARLFIRSDTDGMVWYKVLIGKHTNRQEAQEFANAFSAKEEMASIVSKIDEF
jgi:septal ring-binding cell division protein DamX